MTVAAGGAASDVQLFSEAIQRLHAFPYFGLVLPLSAHCHFCSPYTNGRGGLTDDGYRCTVHDNLPDRAMTSLPFLLGCSGICNAMPPLCLGGRVHDASPVVSALIFLRQTSLLQSIRSPILSLRSG